MTWQSLKDSLSINRSSHLAEIAAPSTPIPKLYGIRLDSISAQIDGADKRATGWLKFILDAENR